MILRFTAITLFTFLLINTNIYAQKDKKAGKKTVVAIMNFANYGDAGIKHLAQSIPESISSSMADIKEIRIVERAQLGQIVNEITLEQTGLVDTGGVERAGKIAKADVLILGSISGSSGNVTVTIKAVEVATGKLISGKVIQGTIGNITQRSNQEARTLAAIISGAGIGMISISTNPSMADVFIDGVSAGKSPVVEYKVTVGDHRILATKEGYMDYDESVTVTEDQHQKLNPFLAEFKYFNRSEAALGISYIIPFSKDLENSRYYFLQYGHSFERVIVSLEAGYSEIGHDQDINMPLLGKVTQERDYTYVTGFIHGKYRINPNWKYFSPYAGVIIGYSYITDYRTNKSGKFEDDLEKLGSYKRAALGASAGFLILPYAKFSLFIDARYLYYPQKMERRVFYQNMPGALAEKTEKYNLNFMTIGGGAIYYF